MRDRQTDRQTEKKEREEEKERERNKLMIVRLEKYIFQMWTNIGLDSQVRDLLT